ncbi:MAG: hypothetical protein ACLFPD_01925 [Desulfosudaceae bacterium]
MIKSKLFWQGSMTGAAAGWIFILYGLLAPLPPGLVTGLWWVILILWVIGHPLELFQSLSVGRQAGIATGRTIIMTLVFGITWWIPIKLGVFTESS